MMVGVKMRRQFIGFNTLTDVTLNRIYADEGAFGSFLLIASSVLVLLLLVSLVFYLFIYVRRQWIGPTNK